MLFLLVILILIWLLLVYEAPTFMYTAGVAIVLLAASGFYPSPLVILLWLLFIVATALLHLPQVRKPLLTRPLLDLFRKIKPNLSDTEKEALEAGDAWWEGDLFNGRPEWSRLLALPSPRLNEREQAFMDGPVNELCALLDDWDITHTRKDLSPQAWEMLKSKGFFSMIIPQHYGGLEFSASANSRVITKISSHSLTAAVTVMVPNSLGPAELLMHYGTEEQREYYLPRLASGEEIPCFALTGPTAGSDAAAIPDLGIVCRGIWDGEEMTGIRLNWDKRYITLAPVATLIGLAFRMQDPDGLLGGQKDIGITCALVPAHLPGITIGQRHNPLGVPFMNGPTRGEDVFVPLSMIIGGIAEAGNGWRMLMQCLAAGRGISLPALSLGAAKRVVRDTGAYARIRQQFGIPIGRFEGVEEVLTRIAGETWLMQAARDLTCAALDQGINPSVISAIIKQNLTERMRRVVNDGMDIEAGKGICLGPSNRLAANYQAIPIGITVEGANILSRSMIIFGQGAIRCHPFIYTELQAADNPDRQTAVEEFDRAFFGHVALTLRNSAAALFYGLTAGRFISVPYSPFRRWYQRGTRFATAFSLTSDLLMGTMGGNLKLREKLTGRMADVLSELYLLSAALKTAEQKHSSDQADLLEWNCRRSLQRIEESLLNVMRNLPLPLHLLLRILIFPFGCWAAPPSDALGARVAKSILSPGPIRDLLISELYHSNDPEAPEQLLNEAFQLAPATDPLEKSLRSAIKAGSLDEDAPDLLDQAVKRQIITSAQRLQLQRARELRQQIIAVDSFPGE